MHVCLFFFCLEGYKFVIILCKCHHPRKIRFIIIIIIIIIIIVINIIFNLTLRYYYLQLNKIYRSPCSFRKRHYFIISFFPQEIEIKLISDEEMKTN